jgi:hypothetical protein
MTWNSLFCQPGHFNFLKLEDISEIYFFCFSCTVFSRQLQNGSNYGFIQNDKMMLFHMLAIWLKMKVIARQGFEKVRDKSR